MQQVDGTVKKYRIAVAGIVGENIGGALRKLLREDHVALACTSSNYQLLRDHIIPGSSIEWISISPLQKCIESIKASREQGNVLVVTSGDPLFYGMGKLLLENFSRESLDFFPSVSSMQYCFSRFKIPWENASFLSLHGRSMSELSGVLSEDLLFLFTDKANTPDAVAAQIVEITGREGALSFRLHVGENLGTGSEKLTSGLPEEIARMSFGQPNVLVVQKIMEQEPVSRSIFGLKEEQVQHSRGLITKNEVRAAVLHSLALPRKGIFWDIGSGSGSISIEAARMNPFLSVYSIEQSRNERANMDHNRKMYSCWNMNIIEGHAPEILSSLPAPVAVFIGGSGGRLEEIIDYVASKKRMIERIVVTGVIEKTKTIAPKLLHKAGYDVSVSILSVKRVNFPFDGETELNTIHIIKAER